MNTNYEEWNAKQWQECLVQRDKVLATYYKALKKYIALPACDDLVERDLRKEYDADTLDITLGATTPPITYIIHEWDKENGQGDDEEDDEGDDSVKSNGKLSSKDDKVLGETCYSGIIDIINKWIECIKQQVPPNSTKIMISILRSLSTVGSYIYSCAYSKHYQQDARVCALIQVSINKCIIISQCMTTLMNDCAGYPELESKISESIKNMSILNSVLKEYLSEVLTPGNRY